MKDKVRENRAPRAGTVRISVTPGASSIKLLAAAVEKSVRAGAGLISSRDFLWPDYRLTPALVHPSGKGLAPVSGHSRPSRRS
jgi:hypothetical protein